MKIEKIKEKIEIRDLQVNGDDPCKAYYDDFGLWHEKDCDKDCHTDTPNPTAYGSPKY